MPRYEITSPDGKRYEITAPEGATQEQVLSYVQQNFAPKQEAAPKPEPSLAEKGASAIKAAYSLTPAGMAQKGIEAFEHSAYDVGGAVTDMTGSPAAGFAANLGMQAIPVAAGGGMGSAAKAPLQAAGKSVMQTALKPGKSALKGGDAERAITTMLEEGINVSQGGVGKLRSAIDDLNAQISQRIANSPATVDKGRAASELGELIQKFEKQVTPGSDMKAIASAWDEFLQHPLINGNKIPVQLAQELKQGTYKVLAGKYGEQGSAATEAQKSIARGLKEGISEAVPEVGALNAKESQLLNALKLAEARALQAGNNNLGGLSWLASNPAAWAAFMADKSSAFKSIIARMLYSSGKGPLPSAVGAGTAGVVTGATQND